MGKSAARLVQAGDLDGGGLQLLADCDWIVEAIVERPDAKRDLYARLGEVRKPGSIVSSNTSTIPLAALTRGPGRGLRARLPRHPLLQPAALHAPAGAGARAGDAGRRGGGDRARSATARLGKTIVHCKDTPGFIANRIGGLWMQSAINHAVDLRLTVEEADAVMGRPMGVPKTGVFGLLDLVGLDLMPHVAASMKASLPATDAYVTGMREHALITRMIAEGRTGRKGGKGGFYAREKGPAGESLKRAIDLWTGEYRDSAKARLDSLEAGGKDLRALAEHSDRGGQYARAVLLDTLGYAASLVPEIADSPADVDAAMRLGYAWQLGAVRADRQARPRLAGGRAARGGAAGAGAAGDGGRSALLPRAGRTAGRCSARTARTATSRGRRACCCFPTSSCGRSRWRATARRACGTSATASPASNSTAR